MDSIDYDFDNLVNKKQTETKEEETESATQQYSVSQITGKSNILFVVKGDSNTVDLSFVVMADFDNKSMQVKVIEEKTALTVAYYAKGEKGLTEHISNKQKIDVDKYAIFNKKDFKTFLSKFDGINVNIKEKIDFKSQEYNLYLESGEQSISGDIAFKILAACDDKTVEKLLCDVINSVLTPRFIEKSDSLFKTFVNSCTTDISIIDYTDNIEKLRIYANARDKFRPTPYNAGE